MLEELVKQQPLWAAGMTLELVPLVLVVTLALKELHQKLRARKLAVNRLRELNLHPPRKRPLSQLLRVLNLRRARPVPMTSSTGLSTS